MVKTSAHHSPWTSLRTPSDELRLEFTLPTGQSFRWRKTGDNEYTGVIGLRVVRVQQQPDDVQYTVLKRGLGTSPEDDDHVIRDYFNLGTSLSQLSQEWAARDPRFKAISPYFPGARMLRQDPVECLFQFLCSSNNHISRIHGMVERLCSTYGTPLSLAPAHAAGSGSKLQPAGHGSSSHPHGTGSGTGSAEALTPLMQPPPTTAASSLLQAPAVPLGPLVGAMTVADTSIGQATVGGQLPATASNGAENGHIASSSNGRGPAETIACAPQVQGLSFYAFPTLQQLAVATEEELRDSGFGYRAKFITESIAQLLAKPEGGEAWLMQLRKVPYPEAVEALCELPGIGPKVAACICLFSLDKHCAIPVDTHVWQIAVRYYLPQLRGKSLTKKVHQDVQEAFVQRFGSYAGWAHNTLFISELASQRERLPEALRPPQFRTSTGGSKKRQALSKAATSGADADADAASGDEGEALLTSQAEALAVAATLTTANGSAAEGRVPISGSAPDHSVVYVSETAQVQVLTAHGSAQSKRRKLKAATVPDSATDSNGRQTIDKAAFVHGHAATAKVEVVVGKLAHSHFADDGMVGAGGDSALRCKEEGAQRSLVQDENTSPVAAVVPDQSMYDGIKKRRSQSRKEGSSMVGRSQNVVS